MPSLVSKICYCFLPRFVFVFCPDFMAICPFCCGQLACFYDLRYIMFSISLVVVQLHLILGNKFLEYMFQTIGKLILIFDRGFRQ